MKILDYANSIDRLDQIKVIIGDLPENEWHNVSQDFLQVGENRLIFATRTIPIHNSSGYAGTIHQFLWRQNMDYYNISSEASSPKKEWKPSETDYPTQLSAITTLTELYTFRSKLKADLSAYKELWKGEGHKAGSKHLSCINESEFFIQRVEAQIKSLESQGVFLAAVGKPETEPAPKQESPEKTKIEKEATRLGVLRLFRELQLVANESEWVYGDSKFEKLYGAGLVVRLSIEKASRYAYLWRHDMDYENYFQVKAS